MYAPYPSTLWNMLQPLLHTHYIKLSLIPRASVRMASVQSYIKATPSVMGVASHCRSLVDMVDLGPSLSLRKNERSLSAGHCFCWVPKWELEATQFAFVCPCLPHLYGMGKLLCCTAVATSLIVVPKVPHLLAVKWLSLQVVRVYYATPQVDKEHKTVFSALKLESSSPVQ